MKKHWLYLKYIVRHKWFVLLAGLRIGAPRWRLIVHDWSKFLPSEWFPYVDYFYDKAKANKRTMEAFQRFGICELAPWPWFIDDYFNLAWMRHQKRNKHHWQYWTWIRDDDGAVSPATMPNKYVLEMVADWAGAGRAITGRWEVVDWYEKNKHKMKMRDETRERVRVALQRWADTEVTP